MRRLAPLALVLALVCVGGSARADTFAVLPTQAAPFVLPSFTSPNPAGSILTPASLQTAPSSLQQLDYSQLLGLWQQAGASYGIRWQVLAAINKVESNFGRNMGPSSAGAIGWMQFMPSTWLRWGTDATGDGVADPWNATDAIYSAARYLAAAGGSSDLYRAVYAYNHADWYVREVLGLADTFGGDGTIAFSLDRMQQDLDSARRAVAAAGDELIRAEQAETRAAGVVRRLLARADRARLLSDRLDLQQQAGAAEAARAQAAELVGRRNQALATAQVQLERAQQASAPASFAPGAAQILGGPSSSGGYVFPVGGGPGQVFASHTHHDYPAVDIAAPAGSPEYALADSVVLAAWSGIDPRCGIGFTIRAFDGQVWTYCHLSYRDPAVVKGASLSAGQQVGLVGSTGHATGPHLHLQLQPATSWPQRQSWFLSFAGTAFTWSDGGASLEPASARTLAFVPATTSGPVFEVVEDASKPRIVAFTRIGP
jgi:murein DD-endopeptidase MepM/ murein hydrolase activator NlpD